MQESPGRSTGLEAPNGILAPAHPGPGPSLVPAIALATRRLNADMASTSPYVIDVTDQTFGTAVLEESMRRLVVVDFWADWCGPCKMIGPVLERLANEKQGAFLLAKLDVDANQQTAG